MASTGWIMTQAQFPQEQTVDGQYDRQEDEFRDWVTDDGSSGYPSAKGRYHLYVSWACPVGPSDDYCSEPQAIGTCGRHDSGRPHS